LAALGLYLFDPVPADLARLFNTTST